MGERRAQRVGKALPPSRLAFPPCSGRSLASPRPRREHALEAVKKAVHGRIIYVYIYIGSTRWRRTRRPWRRRRRASSTGYPRTPTPSSPSRCSVHNYKHVCGMTQVAARECARICTQTVLYSLPSLHSLSLSLYAHKQPSTLLSSASSLSIFDSVSRSSLLSHSLTLSPPSFSFLNSLSSPSP
jgi:hypothetical protein